MTDQKKISTLTVKAVLILLPTFLVPALLAVFFIKRLELSGLWALLPLSVALVFSWFVVLRILNWARTAFAQQGSNK